MIIQAILTIIIIGLLIRGVVVLRKRQLSLYVSMAWALLWLAALIVVLWPDLTSQIAVAVGIGRGADLVVYVSVLTIFGILFKILVHFDSIDQRITHLAQSMALRDYERKQPLNNSGDTDPNV